MAMDRRTVSMNVHAEKSNDESTKIASVYRHNHVIHTHTHTDSNDYKYLRSQIVALFTITSDQVVSDGRNLSILIGRYGQEFACIVDVYCSVNKERESRKIKRLRRSISQS